MRAWLTRNRATVVPGLVLAGLVLTLAILLKHGILSRSTLEENKDSLSALNSAAGIIVIVLGGVFSYYRFFRGRTFVERAQPTLSVRVVPADGENIHAVTLTLENIGTLPIWNPLPTVHVRLEGPEGETRQTWDRWFEARTQDSSDEYLHVVDPAESVSFIHHIRVPEDVWVATYVAFVRSDSRQIWKCSFVAPNSKSTPETESNARE